MPGCSGKLRTFWVRALSAEDKALWVVTLQAAARREQLQELERASAKAQSPARRARAKTLAAVTRQREVTRVIAASAGVSAAGAATAAAAGGGGG
eukprot:SAG22_NODE_3850_length_1502_cov_1.397719_3_plen_94_part_01